MQENKFERRFPVQQNAIDLFRDHWASKIERVYPGLTSGALAMFDLDPRPSIAAQHLGLVPGSLHGMNVLELGPLEGAHTYQLAKLGADRVLAIEANSEAFLKCLVVKEILQTPHCQYLLGDCLKFLQASCDQFGMIFCSGILYHMENPFNMIKAISQHTDRVFLWTHYYDPDVRVEPERLPKKVICDDLELTFYEQKYGDYGDTSCGKFWGGNMPTASWLSRGAIEQCFRYFGYEFTVHEDNRVHEYGPCLTATALRHKSIATLKPMPEATQQTLELDREPTPPMVESAPNPRRDARFHHHRSHFLEYVDPSNACGLEIGAFDLPLVEPSEGRCDFADWNTVEYLRDLAKQTKGHNSEFVVPVQFDLRQGYDQIHHEYDWISASHVIEHTPDIIGWLMQIHSKLRQGGILFLVIPDKRYIFDIYRRESTLTDALVAHRSFLKYPSFAQVFDYFYYLAPGVIAHDVWAGNPVPDPKSDFAESLALAERAERAYQDVHCWVMTPNSFSELVRSLIDAQMTKFSVVDLRPTVPGMLDFSVVLRKQ